MNLHGIVSGTIGAINPFIPGTVQISTGSTTYADGSRTPSFTTLAVSLQVQALTSKDLRQLDGLNLNGTQRAIYVNGKFDGVVRPELKGGDLFMIASGANAGTWLVDKVLEQWPDWCKLAVTLQNGS
jgi:hypothetical protein